MNYVALALFRNDNNLILFYYESFCSDKKIEFSKQNRITILPVQKLSSTSYRSPDLIILQHRDKI